MLLLPLGLLWTLGKGRGKPPVVVVVVVVIVVIVAIIAIVVIITVIVIVVVVVNATKRYLKNKIQKILES